MTTTARPLPAGKVPTEQTYYGVRMSTFGVDGEGLIAYTHDSRRAVAAANRFIRAVHGERATMIADGKPKYVQIFDTCGCAPHEPDPVEHHDQCDCEHDGLPPCRDEYGWMSHTCEPNAENAIAVIELEWQC